MTREKTKQFPIGFTERQREMIAEIKEELGYPTIASVVQHAVIEAYKTIIIAQDRKSKQVRNLIKENGESN